MITIAIPFFNAEKFLADAIRSVFAQTFTEWELLLIDDGSSDGSLEIAQSIVDPRVRVISDGQNKKLATRLNEVTRIAKYDYIARMDADDLMSPRRLEIQYGFLTKNPDFDLISTGLYSCSDNNILLGYRGWQYEHPDFADIFSKKVGILHASILARKEWHQRNPYNEQLLLGQDTDLWLRASKLGDLNIKIIDLPLYIYREEGNVTKKKLLRAYKNEREYLTAYIDNNTLRNKFVIKSYLKSIFVSIVGNPKILLNRRNSTVTREMQKDFDRIMVAIYKTEINVK